MKIGNIHSFSATIDEEGRAERRRKEARVALN